MKSHLRNRQPDKLRAHETAVRRKLQYVFSAMRATLQRIKRADSGWNMLAELHNSISDFAWPVSSFCILGVTMRLMINTNIIAANRSSVLCWW
jgi:hypothetical protein